MMIATHRMTRPAVDEQHITRCVDACLACAETITLRAFTNDGQANQSAAQQSADLGCAFLCTATARTLTSRQTADPAMVHELLGACREVCSVSAEECEQSGDSSCARVCRACERACSALVDSVG